jgi:hypothetical protein
LSRLFPELDFLPPEEQGAAFQTAYGRLMRRPRFWLAMILVPAALATALTLLGVVVARVFPIDKTLRTGIIGGVVGGSVAGAVHVLFRRPIRKDLRTGLVARGIPICIPCGYDLRGQQTPRCPECGAAFDPALINPMAGGERERNANA